MYSFLKRITNTLLLALLSISLLGTVSLFPRIVTGSNKFFVLFLLFIFALFAFFVICQNKFLFHFNFVKKFFEKSVFNTKLVSHFGVCSIVFLLLFWQYYCIKNLTGWGAWDWATVAQSVLPGHEKKIEYFSFYPNNLFLLKVEHIVWILTGKPEFEAFFYYLNWFNTILIDIATVLLYLSSSMLFGKSGRKITLFLSLFSFTLLPFVVIPYTDTFSFFTVSLLIFSLLKFKQYYEIENLIKMLTIVVVIGLETAVAYMLKPSTIILPLAVLICTAVYLLFKNKKHFWRNVFLLIIFVLTFWGATSSTNSFLVNHNGLVKIEKGRSLPLTHFMAMGMKGNGSFNVKDDSSSKAIVDPKERNKKSIELIETRLKKFGFVGYLKFIVKKQQLNTADGTFGWGQESKFYLLVNHPNNQQEANTLPRKLFVNKEGVATDSKYNFRLVQQILWTIIIILSIFGIFIKSQFDLVLKLSILGFFLFLLLFEGGRSRYVIQFLPLIILLATQGALLLKRLSRKSIFKEYF
ncbi:hypothetical protein LQZ24_02410 [Fructobacillus sp. M1-13]|uniref:Integral membrane protein n=1 Tax=Fructobacillus papyriferae TaxID=2713171 RepID=A0ABS5QPY6_9LACO|nr:hypothetical protein [Fructobacillus papyriferae]MBS9334892.1 hypothetical protein [Fructobacillus papyriferae]MCD2158882.1 hypothetical protein [Fructobacillus papyriferae]